MDQRMDYPFQGPARVTMNGAWGLDVMRQTVSKIHTATPHDPPAKERVERATA